MVLFLIGLGLGNEKDISIKGLESVRASHKVYLESYTSILGVDR
jgi:diphthine synthase